MLVPRNQRVAGYSYAQLEAAWVRSSGYEPHRHATRPCSTFHHGPVWFVFGAPRCSMPTGSYLFLGGPFISCSTVERRPYHATTPAGLRRCARRDWRSTPASYNITVDNVELTPPGFLVASPIFHFTISANSRHGVRRRIHGRGAAYGYATLLRPLSPGTHTVTVADHSSGLPIPSHRFTFEVTVR